MVPAHSHWSFPKAWGPFPSCPRTCPFGLAALLTLVADLSINVVGKAAVEDLIPTTCLRSGEQTIALLPSFLPSEEGLWMARWQLPDVISWEVSGLSIYCPAWNDGYYCYKYYHAGEAGLQAQTAALFTNIINEVIFNINSPATAFLKTVYGLGHRAICNFYGTSMTGLPPRLISFGRGLVYFMNDKNKPLLAADEGWFMSSKPRPSER